MISGFWVKKGHLADAGVGPENRTYLTRQMGSFCAHPPVAAVLFLQTHIEAVRIFENRARKRMNHSMKDIVVDGARCVFCESVYSFDAPGILIAPFS